MCKPLDRTCVQARRTAAWVKVKHRRQRTLRVGDGGFDDREGLLWFPGAPVLIRSVFAGRPDGVTLFRFFPEAVQVLDGYPSIDRVREVFAAAGFGTAAAESVPQVTAGSLREAARDLRRAAHTPLQLISDDAYAKGLRRLHAAARTESGPVIDTLDLVVLR